MRLREIFLVIENINKNFDSLEFSQFGMILIIL